MTANDQQQFYFRAITFFFLSGWTCMIALCALKVFHDIGWL